MCPSTDRYDIAFLGYGVSNRWALRWFLQKQPGHFFVSSLAPLPREELLFLREHGVENEELQNSQRLLQSHCILVSPGVSPFHPLVVQARQRGIPLRLDLEMAAAFFPPSLHRVGITGTNGKTTTVELTTHLLCQQQPALSLGNIGISPFAWLLEENPEPPQAIVFELSSFQLHFLQHFPLHETAVLNITPDHLAWHGSMDAYVQDKLRILALGQSNWVGEEVLPYLAGGAAKDTDPRVVSTKPGKEAYLDVDAQKLFFADDSTEFSLQGLRLPGAHNLKNAAFSIALSRWAGLSPHLVHEGLGSFPPSPHRLERFAEHQGVVFINDSKATNADAVQKALEAFSANWGHIILLMGGRGKGEEYLPLARAAVRCCREILLCGENAYSLFHALRQVGAREPQRQLFTEWDTAILQALQLAKEGDLVLFSPGGSSFDHFENYQQRGSYFKQTITRLLGLDRETEKPKDSGNPGK